MVENSKIEWTDHTMNPWIVNGASRVRTSAANWRKPRAWDKEAKASGVRRKVFCASLADVFEDRNELLDWRADLFDLFLDTPNLDWLLLTKRPKNVVKMWGLSDLGGNHIFLRNLWIGTSVENQEQADKRIPELLKIPAAVRFLSMEPLLGPVDLRFDDCWIPEDHYELHERIHWVIVGGESGHNARPMHPEWVRSIRDQCQAAGVPFFFKQWGEWKPVSQPTDADEVVRSGNTYFPRGRWLEPDGSKQHKTWDCVMVDRVGKKAAGRELDGRTWEEFPVTN